MSPTTPAAEPPARPSAATPQSSTEPTTEPTSQSTTDSTQSATDAAEPTAQPAAGPPGGLSRVVASGVVTLSVLGLLGAPLGWLWAAVAPDTPVIKSGDGAVYGQAQPEQPVAADGWFSLLGLAFGVLAALAVWFLLRRHRGPVGLVVAAAGGLTAALVAWQVGRRVGLAGYQRLLDTEPDGTSLSKPADLRAGGIELFLGVVPVPYGNVLLPAFAAAVTYTLLAGWSRWPSLRPEPEPDGAWLAACPSLPNGPTGGFGSAPVGSAGEVSSGPAGARPAPSAAPEPPAPGAAEPPRG
ncbi:DUF2567 domain-containing protein [Micromonospora sp. HNM0581]|uniref:DUF2567 domain-containing protein n=1 Tax=Micromonospora sp. HNM0581 TaxID=2716341 RepID=UPI00146EC9E7|nr:DUF2567 domain-containing protein [Micromonospora sp. HNM0581]